MPPFLLRAKTYGKIPEILPESGRMAKPIDPAKSWQEYSKKSFEEKRAAVMELLENAKE